MTWPAFGSRDDAITVTTSATGLDVLVRVTGEIDSGSAAMFVSALGEAVARASRGVTVDLEAVTFLDSSGVAALAVAHRRAVAAGVQLRVAVASRIALRPLQLTGVWALLGEGGSSSAAEPRV